MFPVVCVTIALISICLVLSVPGRHALSCLPGHLIPCWNNIAARAMMRHDPQQATSMLRQYFLRSLEQNNPVATRQVEDLRQRRIQSGPSLKLSLKTATFDLAQLAATTSATTMTSKRSFSSQNSNSVPANYSNDADDVKDHTCSICFVDLVDGDRMGVLPCKHIFHVACLKKWLRRRNVCPLCLHPDVAALSFGRDTSNGRR